MKKVVIVTGSVRPDSVSEKLARYVSAFLTAQNDFEVEVANLREMKLPLFDDDVIPSDESFAPVHESVQSWTQMVAGADIVIFLTPEYNHTMSPALTNAIDWIYSEWKSKPVFPITYGWMGGKRAEITFLKMAETLKMKVITPIINLYFTKQLSPMGEVLDAESFESHLLAGLRKAA